MEGCTAPAGFAGAGTTTAGDGQYGPGTHFHKVKTVLTVLVVLAMLGTVGVLFAGLFGLVSGNQDSARSNKLMRYRVVLQGVALLLFVVLLGLLKN